MFMIRKQVSALLMLSGLSMLAVGCASHEKQKEQPPTAAQQASNQLNADRQAYVQQSQTRIDQMTKHASDLRMKAAQLKKPQNKKAENAADDMDSLMRDANKALKEVKDAAPENWVDYKRDVEKVMSRAETQYSTSIQYLK